jgi:hypothetical protein
MENKIYLVLIAIAMLVLSNAVHASVVPEKWNYYATYDFDLLENNSS